MQFIKGFNGQYHWLSNSYLSKLIWTGIEYPSAEHAFAAGRTIDRFERMVIAQLPTSDGAKSAGRKTTLREGWNEGVAVRVMREVLDAKFKNPSLRKLLLGTDNAMLVETNLWHDERWGDCECGRIECAIPGANLLGICLMDLRANLRAEQRESLLTMA